MKEEEKQRDMWETVSAAVTILHVGVMNLENEFKEQYHFPPCKGRGYTEGLWRYGGGCREHQIPQLFIGGPCPSRTADKSF